MSDTLAIDTLLSIALADSVQDDAQLQPNPAHGSCRLFYNSAAPTSVAVYNLKGELMRRYEAREIPAHSLSIDVETLPLGVYTVQLSNGDTLRRLTLIKE